MRTEPDEDEAELNEITAKIVERFKNRQIQNQLTNDASEAGPQSSKLQSFEAKVGSTRASSCESPDTSVVGGTAGLAALARARSGEAGDIESAELVIMRAQKSRQKERQKSRKGSIDLTSLL